MARVLLSLRRVFGAGCGSGSAESSLYWRGDPLGSFGTLFHEQDVDGDDEEGVCTVLGFGDIFWHIVRSRLVWPRRAITSNVGNNITSLVIREHLYVRRHFHCCDFTGRIRDLPRFGFHLFFHASIILHSIYSMV